MKFLFVTKSLKKAIYASFVIWLLFFLYPHVLSLGYTTMIVYSIQLIVCIIAFQDNTLKFTEDKVEQYSTTYKKDKRLILVLLLLLLILTQFPIIAWIIYPNQPTETGVYSNWTYWCNHKPSDGVVLLDIIMTIIGVLGILYVQNECKDPIKMLEQYKRMLERDKRDRELSHQRKVEHQKEISKKIKLYGQNYISSLGQIIFSEDKSRMWIDELEYFPQEILAVEFDDISTTSQLPQEIKTKTSTGSMIRRGLVGAALLGPAGAIIGGVTAKKKSIVIEGEVIINYRYKLRITTTKVNHELISYESRNLDSIRSCQALIMAFINRTK